MSKEKLRYDWQYEGEGNCIATAEPIAGQWVQLTALTKETGQCSGYG